VKIRVEVKTTALASLYLGLTTVASGDTARAIARDVATDFDGRVQRQFAVGRGPYGNAWPKPKKGNPPGRDTEQLVGAITVRPAGARVLLSASGVTYAGYFARHAGGIFPDASIGLPPAWKQAADAIVRRIISARLKGGR
jgi:hypothetical protein